MSGLGPHRKHSRQFPCPVCGGTTSYCLTFEDGWTICGHVEGDHRRGLGWAHWTGSGDPPSSHDWRANLPPTPSPSRRPSISSEMRDQVFGAWREAAGLTSDDRHYLNSRGFTDAMIDAGGYASHPDGRNRLERKRIAGALHERFGPATLDGNIPGYYYRAERGGKPEPTLAGASGILIPARDPHGYIQAFQVRDPNATDPKKRYTWVSSTPGDEEKPRPGGASSGAPLHVAYARGEHLGSLIDRMALTEGGLKGNFLAHAANITTIAIAGVSAHKDLSSTLRVMHPQELTIAFDADAETNPNVLLNRDQVAFKAAALGIYVTLTTWETTIGEDGKPTPKGIDDAIRAGIPLKVTPYPFPQRSGSIVPVSADALPRTTPKPVRTIDEARHDVRRGIENALADAFDGGPSFVQVRASTGVGKTWAMTNLLNDLYQHPEGWPPAPTRNGRLPVAGSLRVLWLSTTIEAANEVMDQLAPGLAMRQEGRNSDPSHDWNCLETERIHQAGAGRHNTYQEVCLTCMERSGWDTNAPQCGYLRSKARLKDARMVVATAAAYFTASEDIGKFDLVIFDEDMFPHAIETIVINETRTDEWRKRMNQIDAKSALSRPCYPQDSPFRKLIDAIASACARPRGSEWLCAMPVLRELCPDLDRVVRQIRAAKPDKDGGRYPFEMPHLWENDEHRLVPLHAIGDLADALIDELKRDAAADTRLWLTADGLQLLRPRKHIIDLLRDATVVNLDATPHDALRFLFPDPVVIEIDVPAQQHVTQITDYLGGSKELSRIGTARTDRVEAVANRICANAKNPVIFSRKDVMPAGAPEGARIISVDNPQTSYGWFGNHTRGLNRYQDTDLLVVIGRFTPPIPRIRAEVQTARFSPDPAPAGDHTEPLPYLWRDVYGNGCVRFTKADNDPDVNAAIRQSERANILQAIGRGRGVNRPASQPLPVFLLSSQPISGLPIDELTTLEALGAEPVRRGTNHAFQRQTELNKAQSAHRNGETRKRVAETIAAMKAEGMRITAVAVAKRAGISRDTLYADDGCKAMIGQARITGSVGAGTDSRYSLSHPTPTLPVIPTPPPKPVIHPSSRPVLLREGA